MKIAFVNFGVGFNHYGVRLLSSILKERGHSVNLYFPFNTMDSRSDLFYNVDKQKLESLLFHLDGVDIVGFSLHTSYFIKQAYYYKEYIRGKGIPIIWGGAHCIATPEGAIAHNDIICSGEAEICLPELIQKYSETGSIPTDVKGMWVKTKRNTFRNGIPLQVIDLDTLPYPDYDLENNFVWKDKNFVRVTERAVKTIVETMLTRGCVFRCTYCLHSKMNLGERGIRRHSVNYAINQLKYFTSIFPNLTNIGFDDSDFFLVPKSYLSEFTSEYKKHINIPFSFSCSPATWTNDKARLLLDTGLVREIMIGIQSASEKMKQYFSRQMDNNEKIIEISQFISSYHKKYHTSSLYHLIWDTPCEDTADYVATVQLMNRMKEPFELRNHSLLILPGTKIFDDHVSESKKKQLLTNDIDEIVLFYTDQYAGGDTEKRSALTKYFVSLCNICATCSLPNGVLQYFMQHRRLRIISFAEIVIYKLYGWRKKLQALFMLIKRRDTHRLFEIARKGTSESTTQERIWRELLY